MAESNFVGSKSTSGSKVTYRCLDGFVLSSGEKSFATCQRDGTWSQPPFCTAKMRLVNPISCTFIPTVSNAGLISSSVDLSPGSTLTYQCYSGYRVYGHEAVQCGADGTWTPIPTCSNRINCPTLPTVENGRISERTFNGLQAGNGDRIWFSCLPGFRFQNPDSDYSQCREDGTWSMVPMCISAGPRCRSAPQVANGLTIHRDNDGLVYVIQCAPGFAMEGPQVVRCQENGAWSRLPTCTQSQSSCGSLPQVANARVSQASFNNSPRPGDFVNYQCNNGFVLNRVDNMVVCMSSGRWSEAPVCVNMESSCGSAPLIQNAQITFQNFQGGASKENSVAWYECSGGFEIVGSSAIRCGSSGSWSPRPFCRPNSQAGDCGNPPIVENAYLVGDFPATASQVGDQLTFQCGPGYQMLGNRVVTCMQNGLWTLVPVCSAISRKFLFFFTFYCLIYNNKI